MKKELGILILSIVEINLVSTQADTTIFSAQINKIDPDKPDFPYNWSYMLSEQIT